MDTSRFPVLIAAGLSTGFSVMLLVCFSLVPEWGRHPRGGKHMLFCTTVFNFFMSINYFQNPSIRTQCQIQSSLMQFFEIAGSWTYTMFLALELAFSLRVSRQTEERIFENAKGYVFMRPRLLGMHIIGISYAIVSTIFLSYTRSKGRAGAWCWTISNMWLLQSYLILWCELVVIMASCAYIALQINKSHINIHTRRAAIRLVAIPLGFSLLHIPGTIRRCGDILGNCSWCENSILKFLQGICDPSQGSLNFVLYGLTDSRLRRDLHTWLEHRHHHRHHQASTSSPDDSVHSSFSEVSTSFIIRSCFCFCGRSRYDTQAQNSAADSVKDQRTADDDDDDHDEEKRDHPQLEATARKSISFEEAKDRGHTLELYDRRKDDFEL